MESESEHVREKTVNPCKSARLSANGHEVKYECLKGRSMDVSERRTKETFSYKVQR